MELYLGFLDFNANNVDFLHGVLLNPIALGLLIIGFLGLFFSYRPFFAKRHLSLAILLASICLIALVAIFG
jgi:uncharacterized membrane protein